MSPRLRDRTIQSRPVSLPSAFQLLEPPSKKLGAGLLGFLRCLGSEVNKAVEMMSDFKGKQECFPWSSWANKKSVFLRPSAVLMEFPTMELESKPNEVL